MENKMMKDFQKCADYSVLAMLVMNTLTSMSRFKNVLQDKMITGVYTKIKAKAASL